MKDSNQVVESFDPLNMDKPLKILILEDSELDVELIRAKLKKEFKFEDEVVYDREAFVLALDTFIPDIVLSDYSMPQFDGFEALKLMQDSGLKRPFIIITGAIDEETAVSCIKAGADDYLLKDRLTRLPAAIKQSITQYQSYFEKERTRLALEESVRNFLSLGKVSPDYVLLITREGLIKYSNHSELFDQQVEINQNVFSFLSSLHNYKVKNGLDEAYAHGKNQAFTIRINTGEEKDYFFRCRISMVFKEDDYAEFMLLLNDITDIEEAKLDLEFTHLRLRDLLNRIEWIRDDEKKRISLEIHDQLGQELTANKLGLFYIKQQLKNEDENPDKIESIRNKVDDLIDLSGNTIKTVRRIAHQLRPIILDDLGLIPAVEWMIKNFNENTDISWQLNNDLDDVNFDNDFTTAAFRIVQETITNIVRHADANECSISFLIEDEQLIIKILDDGVGFDPLVEKGNGKLGLFGIEERIKPWNGILQINSKLGSGTQIITSFPINRIGV